MKFYSLVRTLEAIGERYMRLVDRVRAAVDDKFDVPHMEPPPTPPIAPPVAESRLPDEPPPDTTAALTIRLLVPLGGWAESANIAFLTSLPGPSEALSVHRENATARLWFDECCAAEFRVFQAHPELRYAERSVDKARMLVVVDPVEEDLCQFIAECRRRPHHDADLKEWPAEQRNIEGRYETLAAAVFQLCVQILTRIIEYCRTEKGQHWLRRVEYDPKNVSAFFRMCKAEVSVRGAPWVKWDPPPHVVWVTTPIGDHGRFLTMEDWRLACEHARADGRLSVVRELLVRAEELATDGYRRSALIEAVAALDVAVARFLERPDLLLRAPSGTRTGLAHSGRLFEKLGLRGSIDFVLPLVLSESAFPESLRKVLQAALDTRGSIVHKGQRDVSEQRLRDYLSAIRTVCHVLEEGA